MGFLYARLFLKPLDDLLGWNKFKECEHFEGLKTLFGEQWKQDLPPEHEYCKLKNIDYIPDVLEAVSQTQAHNKSKKRECLSILFS